VILGELTGGCEQAATTAQHCVCAPLLEEFKTPLTGRLPATPRAGQRRRKCTCSDWKRVKGVSKTKTYLRY